MAGWCRNWQSRFLETHSFFYDGSNANQIAARSWPPGSYCAVHINTECVRQPEVSNQWIREGDWEASVSSCLGRAQIWHDWCGNPGGKARLFTALYYNAALDTYTEKVDVEVPVVDTTRRRGGDDLRYIQDMQF